VKNKASRMGRIVVLMGMGGFLMQLGTCVAALGQPLFGVVESAILTALLSGVSQGL